jgi:predicted dehydrogenase
MESLTKKHKTNMNEVRLGVIGLGNMGSSHVGNIEAGNVKNLKVTAICDIVPAQMDRYGDKYAKFTDSAKLIRSGKVDAVLVATPHYFHTTIGADALKCGLHTLVEKPISVHKADAQKLIKAHKNPKQVFAAMFQMRTIPCYIKLREFLASGQLGEITRINWLITDWFRTQYYYDCGGWRATWKGEGGGVLLNQAPHHLDLWQWLFGMPAAIRSLCKMGRFHDIEVEDMVTTYMEYANGASAVMVTTTGEAPGTNRLEIAGENGKVVLENGKFTWFKNTVGQSVFLKTDRNMFSRPETWTVDIPAGGNGSQHTGILQNFTNAILHGEKLISPAAEGINAVELANAMLY